MSKNTAPEFVLRPFENLPGEADWVALREVVPAATATARTTAEYGARDIIVTTALPDGWPGLHRMDGAILIALQGHGGSGDASRDLAANLLDTIALEPGSSLTRVGLPGPGPRLQDVLDLTVPFEVTLQEDFRFWLEPKQEITPAIKASLEESAETIIPTVKLESVDSAYLATFGSRRYLRWSMAVDEDALIDAIARLHAKRESALGKSRFLGAFRSCGIVVPVWDIDSSASVEDLEELAPVLGERLKVALENTEPLTSDERRARAGIISRQVTLR